MSPREIVAAVRALPGVAITSVGMRDAGQSDFKNRLRLHDLRRSRRTTSAWASSPPSATAARAGTSAS